MLEEKSKNLIGYDKTSDPLVLQLESILIHFDLKLEVYDTTDHVIPEEPIQHFIDRLNEKKRDLRKKSGSSPSRGRNRDNIALHQI
jgi:hypothetical protein